MKISIIIPSYKPKEYIWECFDSLANQTFEKTQFEIILILNGCNEPYYSDISHYVQNNMQKCNVRVIQTDEGGVSNARNIGLDIAQGDYITFVDDDDYISPSYLQELYDIAITGVLPLSNIIAFDDNTKKIVPYYVTKKFERMHKKKSLQIIQVRSFFSIPVAKLIRRDIIEARRFNPSIQNGEDGLFMLQISDKINKIKFTSTNAIYYRRYRDNSLTTSKKPRRELINNDTNLICLYLKVFIKNPFRYNLLFVFSRIIAAIKWILLR